MPNAFAETDGPDYYQVRHPSPGVSIALRSQADAAAPFVRSLYAGETCLRNLGCRGGLYQQEFATMPPAERVARQAQNPRWCRVEIDGVAGWIEGNHLEEADCPAGPVKTVDLGRPDQTVVNGMLRGRETIDHHVHAAAGQTLTIELNAGNRQAYFNVLGSINRHALFIGGTSGNRFKAIAPTDGDYVVRVYLMRAAARRQEAGRYRLAVALTGPPLAALPAAVDARVGNSPFHAIGHLPCRTSQAWQCEAGVIRRGRDGTASVHLLWPAQDAGALPSVILFQAGRVVAADSTQELEQTQDGDNAIIRIGSDASLTIPATFLSGG